MMSRSGRYVGSLAVWDAAPDEGQGAVVEPLGKGGGESRLPDSGLAEHDHGARTTGLPGGRDGRLQPIELRLSADEGRIEAPPHRRCAVDQAEQPIVATVGGGNRLDGTGDEAQRGRVEQDLVRRRPGGPVSRGAFGRAVDAGRRP